MTRAELIAREAIADAQAGNLFDAILIAEKRLLICPDDANRNVNSLALDYPIPYWAIRLLIEAGKMVIESSEEKPIGFMQWQN